MKAMLPYGYTVQKIKKETDDTFTVELKPKLKKSRIKFLPGQFNMIYIHGIGEIPISISGDPDKSDRLLHTTRAVGTVTKEMAKLKQGDTVGIRGPFGRPWPIEEYKGKDILLVAGGIGLAPLRPALYYILNNRSQYGKIILLYGARTPEDILFRKELEKLRSRFDMDIFVTVDRSTKNWRGNIGVITTLIPRAPFDAKNTVAMICGPEIMMRYSILELEKRGIPANRIFVSMERNMKCGIGFCGHCQYGTEFICKDGPVFSYSEIEDLFTKREL